MESHLDPIFQQQVDSKKVPSAAAVALDVSSNVLFSKGYGHIVLDNKSSLKVTLETLAII